MALATPPELPTRGAPVQPLARTYPRGLRIEPHSHAWGQLLYAMSGVMWVDTPEAALVVPPQRAVWLPPGLAHGIRVASDLQLRNLYLRPALAAEVGGTMRVLQVPSLLRELIIARVAQGDQPGEYQQALDALLVLALQRAQPAGMQVPLPTQGDRRLRAVCEAVLREPSLVVSFEQHAEQVGASTRTLARLFKAQLGQGFTEWRRQVHLAYATTQRLQGVPVSRIAAQLGYAPASFSDMYRRALGVAPSAVSGPVCPIG
ncbi:AraC family transcriptional regulator [Pseudomonas typographi]|uniref:AraC family transcriptional regulator n=1 Tax=Pseudomonas typographi TaxID=2715964 RepID=A0ABR7YX52_9PSED|nr:helix-turn-helix transcriptional regulator [Pseudomonas typographi]MBD1597782.1 AraC family transcriptional regulator [Pseudomonas typographi]